MERDGSEAQIPKQKGSPLGVVASTAEYHEWIAGKFIQNID